MEFLLVKNLHVWSAMVTITGFMLRGYWMVTGSGKLQHRITRTAPHLVDTILLSSGIALLVMLSLNPFSQSWLVAKFTGLIAYILLGTVAIRRGATLQIRMIAFVGAFSVFAYIVGVALSKSPASWLAVVS